MTIKTGVIVATSLDATQQDVVEMLEHLADRFPSVTFAVAAGAVNSLCFPFDDGTPVTQDPAFDISHE